MTAVPVVFKVKLGKTGHSLKVTLPRPIIDGFGWKEGDEIVLYVSDAEVVLRKSDAKEPKK